MHEADLLKHGAGSFYNFTISAIDSGDLQNKQEYGQRFSRLERIQKERFDEIGRILI